MREGGGGVRTCGGGGANSVGPLELGDAEPELDDPELEDPELDGSDAGALVLPRGTAWAQAEAGAPSVRVESRQSA